jgi:hypothetical protein
MTGAARTRRKKRVRAAGWRVGDAMDFLGLSDEEAAVVEMKLVLAESLRKRRVARRMTQLDLARDAA